MLGISTADVNLIEPVLPVSLIYGNHSGIIHSAIGFSFVCTFIAAVLSQIRNVIRKRKGSGGSQ